MSADVGGIGGISPVAYSGAAGHDPKAQARILQKEFDTLLHKTQLRMQVDVEAGRIVVQVIDASSGDVLRQIPREDALRLARDLAARHSGATG